MKIKRKANSLQSANNVIEALTLLEAEEIKIKAFGNWVDENDDPWNTPMEIEVKRISEYHPAIPEDYKIFNAVTGEPAYQAKGEYPMQLEIEALIREAV